MSNRDTCGPSAPVLGRVLRVEQGHLRSLRPRLREGGLLRPLPCGSGPIRSRQQGTTTQGASQSTPAQRGRERVGRCWSLAMHTEHPTRGVVADYFCQRCAENKQHGCSHSSPNRFNQSGKRRVRGATSNRVPVKPLAVRTRPCGFGGGAPSTHTTAHHKPEKVLLDT